jgi:hypothetical protein
MKRLLILLAACLATTAGATAKVDELTVNVTIGAKQVHEECTRLEAGQSRRWHWKATAPVDFNIHYHRGEDVFYPVKRDGMRGDGGTFTAKTGEDYCWMWTVRDAPTKIEGAIRK